MSKGFQEQQKTDEVDIIQIFNLIGNAFKRFFNFLFSIFEYIFTFFIVISLFLKNNIKLFLLAIIIGALTGFFYDKLKEDYYTSSMIIEPNYNSNNQIIDNIRLLGQLARSRDSVLLSQMLSISPKEASQLIDFEITPNNNNSEKLKLYNDFVKVTDTSITNKMDFDNFSESTVITDYKQYYVTVSSKERNLFKKLESRLAQIPVSEYIRQLQKVDLELMDIQSQRLNESLEKVEQLRADYKQLMLQELNSEEPKASPSGTNFYLGSTENIRPTNELELFKIEENFRIQLNRLTTEKSRKSTIVNVVSGFQDIGIKVRKNYKFLIILSSFGIAVVFLLLKQFNKFLIQYENKLNSKN